MCLLLFRVSVSSFVVLKGCGHGCSLFPLLALSEMIHAVGFDFSSEAIKNFKANPQYDSSRCTVFVHDATEPLPEELVPSNSFDRVLLVFVLSAILPAKYPLIISQIFRCLRPGAIICLRDYGLYDLTMLRSTKRRGDRLYQRGDGTLAYFFTPQDLEAWFSAAGFVTVENEYCTIRQKNRRTGVYLNRVYMHGKFQKPTT